MTPNDIESRCLQLVVETLGLDQDGVTLETRFIEDLGADSLDNLELLISFEDEFGIAVSDEEAESIMTVQQVVDVVRREFGK